MACCSHGADCGAAGPVEMPYWDVSLVTEMSELFKAKAQFNADISRWGDKGVVVLPKILRFYLFSEGPHGARLPSHYFSAF